MRSPPRPLRTERCITCHSPGSALCSSCVAQLHPAPAGPVPDGVDGFVALFVLEGVGRTLVHRWKFQGCDGALAVLATSLVAAVPDLERQAGLVAPSARCDTTQVTWAPTAAARRRARGRDQAQDLASSVAHAAQLPLAALLARSPGMAQTGRSRAERLDRQRGPAMVPITRCPSSVLLVDDVTTTGATLGAAARALRAGGATTVLAAVLARTPSPTG